MGKTGVKGFTLIVIVIVCAGLFYYTYLNNQSGRQKSELKTSQAERLLNYNFAEDYPKTVRETVKLHIQFLKLAYSGECSEQDLATINRNIRQLFDPDLLEINSEDEQLSGLKNEIEQYQSKKLKLSSFTVGEGSQVERNTEDGVEYAKTKVTLVIGSSSAEEEYLLRKDEEGKWRIMGWQTVKDTNAES